MFNINLLSTLDDKICLFNTENNREIFLYHLNNVSFALNANRYPDVLIKSNNLIVNPIEEKIMSLSDAVIEKKYEFLNTFSKIENDPLFFFVYNFDNYFHFLYDTIPYLISYEKIKIKIPKLKLLVQLPPLQNNFCNFVYEFLNLFGIKNQDLLIVDPDTLYNNLYISSSYTHGIDSNLEPRKEIYDLFNNLKNKVKDNISYPENIYISRRTWIDGNSNNIGTDYTSRRVMENEDELVEYLKTKKYVEIFSEKLSTIQKINLFSKAKNIIGSIGGGMANVLFSNNAKVYTLISPTFMEKNQRFKYVFKNTDVVYFNDSYHVDAGLWKKYMRVKVVDRNIIGEIEYIMEDGLMVSYVDTVVAGWNRNFKTKKEKFKFKKCIPLDTGLNSPWKIDIDKFKLLI